MTEKSLNRIFWLFLLIHTLTWTLFPVLIRHALSDDFIEAVTWGQQFSFGYDKNPWLTGWLAHLGILLGGESGIGIYALQSLFVASGFYAIWRLACSIMGPVYALVAVMMYEGCACYAVDLQGVNDNYILLGLLPIATLFFWRAMTRDRLTDWLLTGTTIALACMGKYDAALAGLAMLCCLISDRERRHWLLSWKCWSALLLALLILLPNFIWLYHHDFLTLRYAFVERAHHGQYGWSTHAIHNLHFLLTLGENFLPALILALLACSAAGKNLLANARKYPVSHRDLAFVFWAGPGPALLLLALGFGLSLTLHREWGNTFLSSWGAFLLARFHPRISRASLKRFVIVIFTLQLIWPVGYLTCSYLKDTGSFPGREIAARVTGLWHESFHVPLSYVAGDRYLAGFVGLHSKDHPAVWMEWNSAASPWIDPAKLRCKGALFILDSGHSKQQFVSGTTFPATLRAKFPELHILPAFAVPWVRNRTHRKDIRIVVGLLAPQPGYCVTHSH